MSNGNQLKKIAFLGAGSWGGTLAQHLASLGHMVSVWHRNGYELSQMVEKRRHPFLEDLEF
ncbi:MAG: NAD(P)-binding domain-containing protein, partial [Rhodospirillales bacterium]|nr:NAD(P)-binding domain-containing protein [Rhodospirillales bacterium]